MEVGISLSSEEHGPEVLLRQAQAIERAGFKYAAISDHFHPWVDAQGESPFVWSVIGGIAATTDTLEIGTMVTCPMIRTHPAIIAQAAATSARMMPGRFFLGVGSGEALNEHVVGEVWPRAGVRLEMLEEAIEVMRRLWTGETVSYDGAYYSLDTARIYTMPDEPPPIYVAAAGPEAAELAGRAGDGLITTSPDPDLAEAFQATSNRGPRFGQLAVSFQATEQAGIDLALEKWPTSGLKGAFKFELPMPSHFEEACANVTPNQIAESVICSRDAQKHIEALRKYEDAGYTRVYVRQIGEDLQPFLDFYNAEVLPALAAKKQNRRPVTAGRSK
jgi:G6PDH family F420-dependent oxidoreductase